MIKRIQKILLPVWIACASIALVLFCMVMFTPLQLIYPGFMIGASAIGLVCFAVWMYMAMYGRRGAVMVWRVLLTGLVVAISFMLLFMGMFSALISAAYYPSPTQAHGVLLIEDSWLESSSFTVAPKKYGVFYDQRQQKQLDMWPSHPPAQREVHWQDGNHAQLRIWTDAVELPKRTYMLEIDEENNLSVQTSGEPIRQVEYGWDASDL